ncbi:glutamate synthase-related protein, partial [Bacillus sp. WP8]|uniref:glutamate synthase-related protein n=1 Tax=Bacillus sp. WP8 TaxID=756828 RepID=UPI0037BEFC97
MICQIPPALFPVRTHHPPFSFQQFKKKTHHDQVKPFQLNLPQRPKTPPRHIHRQKLTQQIPNIPKFPPHQSIHTPNPFHIFHSIPHIFHFIEDLPTIRRNPVPIKLVLPHKQNIQHLPTYIKTTRKHPHFITLHPPQPPTPPSFHQFPHSPPLPIFTPLPILHQ